MDRKFEIHHILILALFMFSACTTGSKADRQLSPAFKEYWFSGTAEVSSYALSQSRYGQQRDGHAVLIFVTEPFSREKQVKLDGTGEEGIPVMKLNFIRKFVTGIYPYSTMLSTFSPLPEAGTSTLLKETFSAQEWCGQVYMQLNKRQGRFQVQSFSYFEQEGDQEFTLDEVITEDEIWTRIKIDPGELPEGNIRILPGVTASRLQHFDLAPVNAVALLSRTDSVHTYEISYPEGRKVSISYSPDFPHIIQKWQEQSGSSITTAVRMKTFNIPYWQLNKNRDQIWRDSLHLN